MGSLLLLSIGYFISYIGTGLAVKFFTGSAAKGFMGLSSMQYLVYSTTFSNLFCLLIVLVNGWHKRAKLSRHEQETLILSGACTAFVIPTSTLILSFPISVMVAMVLMRVSVIVASRMIDFILNWQGLQSKKIPWQEDLAVLFAGGAVAVKLILTPPDSFHFNTAASLIMFFYFLAYMIRLYIMNRAKLLGLAGKSLDQRHYFGMEQLYASLFVMSTALITYLIQSNLENPTPGMGQDFLHAFTEPHPLWLGAAVSGLPYSLVAFFSVFLFLFPGKSATFTGVTNRLVSLMGGTAASLILYLFFGADFPPREDWIALGFILAAIGLLAWGNQVEQAQAKKTAKTS
jgi:hypothetical protein